MSWLLAIALALAAFALGGVRVPRRAAGLDDARRGAGARPRRLCPAGEPRPAGRARGRRAAEPDEVDWALVEARQEMVASGDRSRSNQLIVADALRPPRAVRRRRGDAARRGRAENPRDGEAWLALGNALVEHADGALTQPALLAYRRAAELDPDGAGPGYFLGLALIRQGRLVRSARAVAVDARDRRRGRRRAARRWRSGSARLDDAAGAARRARRPATRHGAARAPLPAPCTPLLSAALRAHRVAPGAAKSR